MTRQEPRRLLVEARPTASQPLGVLAVPRARVGLAPQARLKPEQACPPPPGERRKQVERLEQAGAP